MQTQRNMGLSADVGVCYLVSLPFSLQPNGPLKIEPTKHLFFGVLSPRIKDPRIKTVVRTLVSLGFETELCWELEVARCLVLSGI